MRPGTAALAAVRMAAAAATAACVCALVGWMLVAATPTLKRSAGVESLKTSSLSGRTILMILLTWVSLLVATLLVLALRRMPDMRTPPAAPARDGGWYKVRRLLG